MTTKRVEKDAIGYHTRALARGLSILDAFGSERRALAVKDLHLLLDLPKPTVSRLAALLERSGYLRRHDGAYLLGPKLFELGSQLARQDDLEQISQPTIQALAAEQLQTCCLALLVVPDVVHVVVAHPPTPVRHQTEVGDRAPAYSTALGKALLAALPDEALRAVVPQMALVRNTTYTICDRIQLMNELRRTRERGFALDNEETALGLKCVAVTAELPRFGRVAISLSGPAANFHDRSVPVFVDALSSAVQQLVDRFEPSPLDVSPRQSPIQSRPRRKRRSR